MSPTGVAFGISLGILLTLCVIEHPRVRINWEISVIQLLNLVMTIAIAIFFQHFLKQRSDFQKAGRDIVGDRLKAASAVLAKVRDEFAKAVGSTTIAPEQVRNIKFLMKNLSASISHAEELLSAAGLACGENRLKAIRNSYLIYKRRLTGESFDQQRYTDEDFIQEAEIALKLELDLALLAFEVSQARR